MKALGFVLAVLVGTAFVSFKLGMKQSDRLWIEAAARYESDFQIELDRVNREFPSRFTQAPNRRGLVAGADIPVYGQTGPGKDEQ